MVSSDTSSDRRHRNRGSRRSRDRNRSRSRSRERTRRRSWDRDRRAEHHSRSRSRSGSRGYRSRSRSWGRYQPYSSENDRGYDRYADPHFERGPSRWVPGAGCTGHPAGDLPPWRARGSWDDSRHIMDRWDGERGGDGDYEQHSGQHGRYVADSWPGPPCSPRYDSDYHDHLYADDDREYDDSWNRRRRSGERSSYDHSRGGSDTDREFDILREIDWQKRSRDKETPTASIFIKGLPEDADEADIYKLFEGHPSIHSVKLLRDRLSGRSRGAAFVDFAHVDDARLLMDSEQRWTLSLRGHSLLLDYSHGTANRPVAAPGETTQAPAQDWICDMCSAVNFARRLECYHCYTARPANPRRVVSDLNEPSHILKISGLEPSTSEETLFQFCAAVVSNIVDLRVIKDKYTGAPRGFAFVECGSIAEAGSLMLACQGQMLPGQSTPLKICYAKAKEKLLGATEEASAAINTAATVAADTGPLGWKPKEFDASTVFEDKAATDGSARPHDHNSSPAGGTCTASDARARSDQQQQDTTGAPPAVNGTAAASTQASDSEAAAAAGVDAATIQALTQAGFAYEPSSGYWYDAKSGYYYDAKTQLYYHHSTGQWYRYDHTTSQYTALGEGQQQEQPQQQQQQQHVQVQQAVAGTVGQAVEQQQQQRQKQQLDIDKRRRAAVIGSAPQYNRQGLLAAAALAKEKEEEQRRVAAAKAARERQQQQQNKGNNKQQLMPGKPGIGALSSSETGSAAVPAAAAHVVADGGKVQGVVYKSKWAQRQQR